MEETTTRRVRITLRYFDGCPSWRTTYARLREVIAEDAGAEIVLERVETAEDAERLRFAGSPTVLIDGRDSFEAGAETFGLTCRVYETPKGFAGSPTVTQLRAAVQSA